MLVISRTPQNKWVDIIHESSGDVIRVGVQGLSGESVQLVFDDDERNFRVLRDDIKSTQRPQYRR